MKTARITLEDVIAKNYDHISNLDVDLKHLASYLQHDSKLHLSCFKNRSLRTIEEGIKGSSNPMLERKLSQHSARTSSLDRESDKRRDTTKDCISLKVPSPRPNLHPPRGVKSSSNVSAPSIKKLHRYLFEMELPAVRAGEKPRKTKFTILPVSTKTETERHNRKCENEEIPMYIKAELEDNFKSTIFDSPEHKRAQSMMKIKRRSKILPTTPRMDRPAEDDKGIKPYIT